MATGHDNERAIVWLRRDLRLDDHAALGHALATHARVLPVFVFDTEILDALTSDSDRRVEFILESLRQIESRLALIGRHLRVAHGPASREIPRLAAEFGVATVVAARDYEPSAVARDERVARQLESEGRRMVLVKDHAIFDRDEILTRSGRPYSVYTPYRRAWLERLSDRDLAPVDVALDASRLIEHGGADMPSLARLGFRQTNLRELAIPVGPDGARRLLEDFAGRIGTYDRHRDYPALKGPSYLSAHLRFGTMSIRAAARLARETQRADPGASAGATVWLSELIWRDFYLQILHHHPHVVSGAFRPEFNAIEWVGGDAAFDAWCAGRTGYPLVDAAMAQINHSGYMHNRLRMVVASFLVKDLGVDWRRGEAYFARQLLDFDLAANNGGWQWAASTGCDAQPWFRIFNPVTQSTKFDPAGRFIRRYLPQLAQLSDREIHAPWQVNPSRLAHCGVRLGVDYPPPLVDHARARASTLERYGRVRAPSAAGD